MPCDSEPVTPGALFMLERIMSQKGKLKAGRKCEPNDIKLETHPVRNHP